jgi:hypothetical protein
MNMAIEQIIDIPENREVRFTLPKTVPSGRAYMTFTAGNVPDDTPTPNDIDEFYGCFKGKGVWEGNSVELIRKVRNEW